jgi:hypothetical protein
VVVVEPLAMVEMAEIQYLVILQQLVAAVADMAFKVELEP